jgi:hypothetical protein
VVDTASRHATASAAAVQQAVSTHPASASGIRLSSRPVSGHLGSSSSGSGGRPSAVQPSAVQPSGVQPSGVCLIRPDASGSSHSDGGGGDPGRAGRATLTTGTGGGPGGCRAVDGSTTVAKAGTRATLPKSRWSLGGRWRSRAAGLGAGRGGRAGPLSDQAGQAGVGSARGGRRRGGRGCRLQHKVAAPARVGGVLGWLRDHGGWSSPRLTPGWAAPEGPGEVPTGMGVRPQRGPSRQRARPARCRQCSDLRRWVVGLPGLEPGTSSLSAKCKEPLCGSLLLQVTLDRRGRS